MKLKSDHRSKFPNLSNWKEEAWKKSRASTGFEPVTSAIPVQCSTNWATKPHIGSKVNLLSSGVLSIRPNIPVWNSGYSIRQMEQYFPVRWINPSQVIRFQVLLKNTKSNRGLFYLSLLYLVGESRRYFQLAKMFNTILLFELFCRLSINWPWF